MMRKTFIATSALCAVHAIAACNVTPLAHGVLSVKQADQKTISEPLQHPAVEKYDERKAEREFARDTAALFSRKANRAPIKLYLDKELSPKNGHGNETSKRNRRLLHISKNHNNHNDHLGHEAQELYFDPANIPAGAAAHGEDPKIEGLAVADVYVGGASLNGYTSEVLTGLVSIRLKPGQDSVFVEMKAKYGLDIIEEDNGAYIVKIDLSKSDFNRYSEFINRANQFLPNPIEEMSFSSLASAQNSAAITNIIQDYGIHLEYIQPVAVPSSPFIRDGNFNPPVSSIDGQSGIDTLEGRDSSGANRRSTSYPWMKALKIPQSRMQSTGSGVKIAVIDSGFKNPEYAVIDMPKSRWVTAEDFFGMDAVDGCAGCPSYLPWTLSHGHAYHGTYSISTIAAGMDDQKGAVGVAPRSDIIQLRAVFPLEHKRAVQRAIALGADVILINQAVPLDPFTRVFVAFLLLSAAETNPVTWADLEQGFAVALKTLSGPTYEAISEAVSHDIPVIVPAGNESLSLSFLDNATEFWDFSRSFALPASIRQAITVGGVRPGDGSDKSYTTFAEFSNYGPAVDLYAPADQVECSKVDGDTELSDPQLSLFGGTSSAAPIVTGVAALMLSKDKSIDWATLVTKLIFSSRTDVREPDGRLVPRVDAYRAVSAVTAAHRANDAQQFTGNQVYPDGNRFRIKGTPDRFAPFGFSLQCPYKFVDLTPSTPLDNGIPQLTVAGWISNSNPSQLETIVIRETNYRSGACFSAGGYVRDAVSGAGVAGVALALRAAGGWGCEGPVLSETTTDSNGRYNFVNIDEGDYTVTTESGSVIRTCNNFTVNDNLPHTELDIVTSQPLSSGTTRFVVTWTGYPEDLDAHLTGPSLTNEGESRFHVYYRQPTYGDERIQASLDRDDTDGYGPEAITATVFSAGPGPIRFAIHDYTNRDTWDSVQLSNASVKVQVFRGSQLITTLEPPRNKIGTVWNVLEMSGDAGVITVINDVYFARDPAYIIFSAGNTINDGRTRKSGNEEVARVIRNSPPKSMN